MNLKLKTKKVWLSRPGEFTITTKSVPNEKGQVTKPRAAATANQADFHAVNNFDNVTSNITFYEPLPQKVRT